MSTSRNSPTTSSLDHTGIGDRQGRGAAIGRTDPDTARARDRTRIVDDSLIHFAINAHIVARDRSGVVNDAAELVESALEE
jgi:hypothetical protein